MLGARGMPLHTDYPTVREAPALTLADAFRWPKVAIATAKQAASASFQGYPLILNAGARLRFGSLCSGLLTPEWASRILERNGLDISWDYKFSADSASCARHARSVTPWYPACAMHHGDVVDLLPGDLKDKVDGDNPPFSAPPLLWGGRVGEGGVGHRGTPPPPFGL